jgi:hypothetical protein
LFTIANSIKLKGFVCVCVGARACVKDQRVTSLSTVAAPIHQPVRLAGGWWLVLVCSKRKVLLTGCWWLVCSKRKVPSHLAQLSCSGTARWHLVRLLSVRLVLLPWFVLGFRLLWIGSHRGERMSTICFWIAFCAFYYFNFSKSHKLLS